jgi:hypothetical protein
VLLGLEIPILSRKTIEGLFRIPLFLLLCVTPGLSQKAQQDDGSLPKYDLHTETKTKGVVDELNLLPREDFTELIIKNGDDKIRIYLCPKPFQEEMGISVNKGDQIAVTGSKVNQEGSDMILARELVKGTDTLLLGDDGNPVWDWRTGKWLQRLGG